jgi:hypothetical protein
MEASGCSWVKIGAAEAAEARKKKADAATAKETNSRGKIKTEKRKAPMQVKKVKQESLEVKRTKNDVVKVKVDVGGGVAVESSANSSTSSSSRRRVAGSASVTFGDGSVARQGDLVLVSRLQGTMTAVLGEHRKGNHTRVECCGVLMCAPSSEVSNSLVVCTTLRRSMGRFRPLWCDMEDMRRARASCV